MKIPALILGTTAALIYTVDGAIAQTPAEIRSIAKAVTVEINLIQDEKVGSGVLVHQQSNLYTLITNRHVVCGRKKECTKPSSTETFLLKFGNGSSIRVPATAVKILGKDIDLATIQFSSKTPYQIAKLAPPDSLKVGNRVYTSGYPAGPRGYSFNQGFAIAVVNKRLMDDRGGYTVVYNAQTQPGMSGGGVFDRNGHLVAIHGQGERYKENTDLPIVSEVGSIFRSAEVNSKMGYNRGIPVRWLVQSLAQGGIRVGDRDPVTPAPAAVNNTADEYFIAGFNKYVEPGDDVKAGKKQAIQLLTQAVRLNPRYESAYSIRAVAYNQIQENRLAISDYDRVIALNPQNANAYNSRGNLKDDELRDFQGAIADYNQAIKIDPQNAVPYYNRALVKEEKLNDLQGAIADYSTAIEIDPNFVSAYNRRGNSKRKINNYQGALADYDRAISLVPQYALAYLNRGTLKADRFNDPQGALADFDLAISFNPNFVGAYNYRGFVKANKLNDPQGALVDYSRAISIKPQYADAYYNRGLVKANKLNDPSGALADYNQSIKLDPQNADIYFSRGNLKANKLNDFQGALVDYSKVIALNPNFVGAYNNRGNLKANKLNDFQGALADYNQAIKIDPQLPNAYGARGSLKYIQLNDRLGGIADVKKAAQLAKVQGDTQVLSTSLKLLQFWGVNESDSPSGTLRDRGF